MNRSLLIKIIIVTAIVGNYSCKDEFLEVPPQNSLNLVTLGNEQGINASLISAYSMLDGWNADWGNGPWGGQGSNWLFGDVMSDDAYKGTEPTDGAQWEAMELFIWSPLDGDLDVKFRTDYEAINRANTTLRLLASTEGLSEDFINNITGEAKFLRAHYHFDLYKIFKHIPYYTEADEDYKKSNTTEAGDYIDPIGNIIADFQAAADLLPETQDQVGRVTKGAAYAYLGKAYLYNKQYAEAKAAFDVVVNSGLYGLQDCYHTIFSVAGENGVGGKRESLLAFQASSGDGSDDAQNANFPDRLTFPHAGSPFGCCGFRQPSQNLVNAYKVDANGLPLFDTFNDDVLTNSDPVDPRLDWVVARPGVPVLNWEVPYSETWVRAPGYAGVFSNKKNLYYANSGQEGTGATWVPTQLSQLNVQLLRYADVLLMLAEAEVELNNLSRALELVNMVRTRAANCAQGPMQGDPAKIAVDIDDPSITWATYRVEPYSSFSSQDYARDAVRFERRLELAMEGHRFFDLRRYGIAKEVMNAYMAVEKSRRSYIEKSPGYQDKHDLYPLPQNQIDLSSKAKVPQLKQNPLW
jgi:starch-binding outer membrane protein, SusD/RagB family